MYLFRAIKEQQNAIVYKVRDNDLYKKNIKIKTLK